MTSLLFAVSVFTSVVFLIIMPVCSLITELCKCNGEWHYNSQLKH